MELTGILKKVSTREGVTREGKPWRVAQFKVSDPNVDSSYFYVDVMDGEHGRIANFDSLVNKVATVTFTIVGREYNGRFYSDVRGWDAKEV